MLHLLFCLTFPAFSSADGLSGISVPWGITWWVDLPSWCKQISLCDWAWGCSWVSEGDQWLLYISSPAVCSYDSLNRSKLMALYCICSEDFIWESDFLCGSSLPLQPWMYSKWIGTTTSSHFEVSRPEPLPLIIHTILCNGLEGIVRYSTLWSSPPERIKNAAPKLIQNNEFLCMSSVPFSN